MVECGCELLIMWSLSSWFWCLGVTCCLWWDLTGCLRFDVGVYLGDLDVTCWLPVLILVWFSTKFLFLYSGHPLSRSRCSRLAWHLHLDSDGLYYSGLFYFWIILCYSFSGLLFFVLSSWGYLLVLQFGHLCVWVSLTTYQSRILINGPGVG